MSRRQILHGVAGLAGVAAVGGCTAPWKALPWEREFRLSSAPLKAIAEAIREAVALLDAAMANTNKYRLASLPELNANHAEVLKALVRRSGGFTTPSPVDRPKDVATQAQITRAEQRIRDLAVSRCLAEPQPWAVDAAVAADHLGILGAIAAGQATHLTLLKRTVSPLAESGEALVGRSRHPVKQLEAALAGEHACIYAYGALGGHLSDDERDAARDADQVHRDRRDLLRESLVARGQNPVPAEAGYALPKPVTSAEAARDLAVTLEERSAATWRAVLATVDQRDRRIALDALTDCAVRAMRWRERKNTNGPVTVPFPGI